MSLFRRRAASTSAESELVRFEPTAVDKDAYRARVRDMVDALAPDGIDEGNGRNTFDGIIDTWARQWDSIVLDEFVAYRHQQLRRLAVVAARLEATTLVYGHYRRRAHDATVAYDAAGRELGAQPPEPAQAPRPEAAPLPSAESPEEEGTR